jgi:ubiquinol-cytochrome c reductase iron-sulfur subunit
MEEVRRYFLSIITILMAGFGLVISTIPFLSAWKPSANKFAKTAPQEIDLQTLAPGGFMIVAWQNKPIWIIRRTQAMLDNLAKIHSLLRDPDSIAEQQPAYTRNEYRALNPEYFIVVGLCTHLGCSPQYKPQLDGSNTQAMGGFFCPCHGSLFDLAGRVIKGSPAPNNLEIPPYRFINAHTILLGEDPKLI